MLAVDATGEILGTVGIFLSGMGSVLTGWLALRYESKRGKEDCEKRIDAFMKGIELREGMLKSDRETLSE
jgi:hypothetical protein